MCLPDVFRDHIVAGIGEFAGTFLFLFFAFFGTQTANQPSAPGALAKGPDAATFIYISLAFSVSLAVNVWVFFRVSGGLFNPAVTLALCVVGIVPFVRALIVTGAQILGAMAAAITVKYIVPGDDVLYAVGLAKGVSHWQGFCIEMLMTSMLVITILMLAGEKTKATFLAPVAIGLALFIAHLGGAYWTGAGINPARAFGPAIANLPNTIPKYHWIYWLGPFTGALIAATFYKLLKVLHYEQVNGDQDKCADDEHMAPLAAKIEKLLHVRLPGSVRTSRVLDDDLIPLAASRRTSARSVYPHRQYKQISGTNQQTFLEEDEEAHFSSHPPHARGSGMYHSYIRKPAEAVKWV